jgi:hypothetical protein
MRKMYSPLNRNDAELLIKEFDSDADGHLNYLEFCNFILPATNKTLRSLCEMRKNSYYFRPEKPLDSECREMIALHIEKELRLLKKREQIKKELLKRDDFVK